MIEKGMKKGGGNAYFFTQIGKSMHIFPPIDLKCIKLPKKDISRMRRAPPHYMKFHLGNKY